MATENNTTLNKELKEMLFTIVEATKKESYIFTAPLYHNPLIAQNLVEINPEIIHPGGIAIATRATHEGIKFATLVQWEEAKETLAIAKERELILRNEVVALFSDANQKKGTENVLLDDDAKLKIVKKLNYSIRKKDAEGKLIEDWIDNVENALDKIEAISPQYKLVADRIIKWEAELSVSEYNKLSDLGEDGTKIKAIMDSIIEIKEATPTVELVEPKAKK